MSFLSSNSSSILIDNGNRNSHHKLSAKKSNIITTLYIIFLGVTLYFGKSYLGRYALFIVIVSMPIYYILSRLSKEKGLSMLDDNRGNTRQDNREAELVSVVDVIGKPESDGRLANATDYIICPFCRDKTALTERCGECGSPLLVRCQFCKSVCFAIAKYCQECGNKIESKEMIADESCTTVKEFLGETIPQFQCSSCSKMTPPGKFCSKCGKPLIKICSACGAENFVGLSKCQECRSPLE